MSMMSPKKIQENVKIITATVTEYHLKAVQNKYTLKYITQLLPFISSSRFTCDRRILSSRAENDNSKDMILGHLP